jgi:hypothetical protein
VNALHRIHAALAPGGLVIDTQPVSAAPPVETDAGELGRLDMSEWARTIEAVDGRVAQTIRDGLWVLDGERRFVVTDVYDDGAEFVADTTDWAGTRLDGALAARARDVHETVRLHQEVRLRVLRAR